MPTKWVHPETEGHQAAKLAGMSNPASQTLRHTTDTYGEDITKGHQPQSTTNEGDPLEGGTLT